MSLFKEHAVRDPEAAARAIPVIDYGPFNLGNIMRRWSNDRFLSMPHGVLNDSGTDRYSIVYFGRLMEGGEGGIRLPIPACPIEHPIFFSHDPEFRAAVPQAPIAIA